MKKNLKQDSMAVHTVSMEETLTSDRTVWIIWMMVVLITVAMMPFVVRMQGVTDLLARCFG
jgi:hypothetical protein